MGGGPSQLEAMALATLARQWVERHLVLKLNDYIQHSLEQHMTKLSSPDLVKRLLALDHVVERPLRGRRGEPADGLHGLRLRRHVPLVPQLVDPLEVGLADVQGAEEEHVRVDSNPQDRGVAVKRV